MINEVINLRTDNPQVTLTSYILDDSLEMLNGRKRPAVIVNPGGGYLYCSDREAEPVALRFAAMGYHAFVLRYSTYFSDYANVDYSKPLPVKEKVGFPYTVQDLGLAFEYIHDHADEWLVDTDRIFLTGYSGGAINCALYSCYWNREEVCSVLKNKDGYRPAANILAYGVYDLRDEEVLSYHDLDICFQTALTGMEKPDKDAREKVSAVCQISDSFPPSFIWSTYNDDAVPVMQSVKLAQALIKAGIPIECHIFEEGGHGLSIADQSTAISKSTIVPGVHKWIDLADHWLMKRFALPLDEKTSWE